MLTRQLNTQRAFPIERLPGTHRRLGILGCPPFTPATPWATNSRHIDASPDRLNLGDLTLLDSATQVVFSFWFRRDLTGWPSATQGLVTRNVANQRQFAIMLQPLAGNGQISLGVATAANGSQVSIFVPDGTCTGEFFHHCVFAFADNGVDAGVWTAVIDGEPVTLQNPSGAIPRTFPAVTSNVMVGCNNTDASPTNHFDGQILNLGIWTGWAPTLADARALWNYNNPPDYRALAGIPDPTYYVPLHLDEDPVELMVGGTITFTDTSVSTQLPIARVGEDEMFERRLVMAAGTEPWFATAVGGPGFYSASPSVCRLEDGTLLGSFSRGSSHSAGHIGYLMRSGDDGLTWPISNEAWPEDANNYLATVFPHGNLSGAASSKRSFTLTRIPEIGATGRIFCIINENLLGATPTLNTTAITRTSNVCRATVASTAGWSTGTWMTISGVTDPIVEANMVQLTVVDATHIDYPSTGPNGPLADGVGVISQESPTRRTWVFYTDNPNGIDDWTAGYDFVGNGVRWNSVGRGRVVRRPDGDLLLPYYYAQPNQSGYVSAVAISTDDGDTWAHYADIAGGPGDGTRYEEPYLFYVGSTLVANIRVDTGAWTRQILRATSTDNGATWSAVAQITGGWSHPISIRRPSDGLYIMVNREDGGGDEALANGQLKVSRDGITWSAGERIEMPAGLGTYLQGDFWILQDGRVGLLWAQHYDGTNTPTRMEAGIIRSCFLNQMRATV